MAYRNTFFRWLFLYSLTFGLTYVLKLFTYLCPETGHLSVCGEPVREKTGNREGTCRSWPKILMILGRRRQQNLPGKANSALHVPCFFSNGF